MRKIFFIVVLCLNLVACGTSNESSSDDVVTRDDVDEIVEQAIQEHDEKLDSADSENETTETPMTKDGMFYVVDNGINDSAFVELVQNYKSYDVEETSNGYKYTLECVNTTGKVINSVRVDMQGTYMFSSCTIQNIKPEEEMVFEYTSEKEDVPNILFLMGIEYAEE